MLANLNIGKCKFRSDEIDTVDHFPEKIRYVSSAVCQNVRFLVFHKRLVVHNRLVAKIRKSK